MTGRARTPNDTATRNTGRTSGSPARTPALTEDAFAFAANSYRLYRFTGKPNVASPLPPLPKTTVDTRRLVGGVPCLDFANTIDWIANGVERPAHTDALSEPAQLPRWGRRVGLVEQNATLRVTTRELAAARRLRSAIYRVFAAIAHGETPTRADVDAIERTFARSVAASELRASDGWIFEWPPDDARRIRFSVAVSAVDLLRSPENLSRVRVCPGDNCGWLFLDTSGRRRWCSMEVCGSRAKMRRLYARRRSG